MKLDKNGYAPSIMPKLWGAETDYTCRHEIYYGVKNREISKRNGFWVAMPPAVHQKLHQNAGQGVDSLLKVLCQKKFEKTHTREEFMKLIGRNYIE